MTRRQLARMLRRRGQFMLGGLGGSGCCCGGCTQDFVVQGCGGIGYSGLTVSVYDSSGGSLLASGTTDGSGSVSLTWSGTTSPWVEVTGQSSRFAAYAQTVPVLCPGTTTIVLAPATGYHCDCTGAVCLLPLADTLYLTDSVYGAVTLTYQTRSISIFGAAPSVLTAWWGTIDIDYSCSVCLNPASSGPLQVDYFYRCGVVAVYGYVIMTDVKCPSKLGFADFYAKYAQTSAGSLACPPTFDFSATSYEDGRSAIYCNGTYSGINYNYDGHADITVTE